MTPERLADTKKACDEAYHADNLDEYQSLLVREAPVEIELLMRENARLRKALESVLPYCDSVYDERECEHGFHYDECPNKDCELVVKMKTIAAAQDALR